MYIENIVIGNPIVEPSSIFGKDEEDWILFEQEKTYFTSERFLPRILVDLGIAPSISEVRRNRKNLVKTLEQLEYLEIKYGKRRLFILVGKE
ncbi:hypothetical protein DW886_14990 [Enterocloster aldenensis]|uniref:hypothetical protein n=1 Tax=Enterocloster aldenensis TaxID=358742 RepID=UPI000E47D249|nr:hypothetical protein DW886_14990 [Enterocloster aldenensis]